MGGGDLWFRHISQFCPLSPITSWKEGPEGGERSLWGGEEWGIGGDAEVDARIQAGPLGTAPVEGRDALCGFCNTCGLVAHAPALLCWGIGETPRPCRDGKSCGNVGPGIPEAW